MVDAIGLRGELVDARPFRAIEWSRPRRLKGTRPAEPCALAALDPATAGETMVGQARRSRECAGGIRLLMGDGADRFRRRCDGSTGPIAMVQHVNRIRS